MLKARCLKSKWDVSSLIDHRAAIGFLILEILPAFKRPALRTSYNFLVLGGFLRKLPWNTWPETPKSLQKADRLRSGRVSDRPSDREKADLLGWGG